MSRRASLPGGPYAVCGPGRPDQRARLAAAGVGILAVALEAGGNELELEEQVAETERAVLEAAGRVPVVAGALGFHSTAESVERLRRLGSTGVAAVRVLPPRPAYPLLQARPEEVAAHLEGLLESAPCPLLVGFDQALVGCSPRSLDLDRLLLHAACGGLSTRGGSFLALVAVLEAWAPRIPVLVGDLRHQLVALELGAAGSLSAAAAENPEAALKLHSADAAAALAAAADLLRTSAA